MEELYRGNFLRLLKEGGWEYVERTNAHSAVVIVAVTPDSELILIDQTRIPQGGRVIELPAGLAGDKGAGEDETLEETANRELIEETGYSANSWTRLIDGPPSPGLAKETLYFLLAEDLTQVGEGGGVDGEDIRVFRVPVSEVEQWLLERIGVGKIVDPKVYIGLFFLLSSQFSALPQEAEQDDD